ncbi:hypothetical protein EVA_09223 [gut metagenome]|uniref:Uncharacterized protein n=1 Tax=gut metagenome TaxID=749906 RepID=J9CR79_9ZZZZ
MGKAHALCFTECCGLYLHHKQRPLLSCYLIFFERTSHRTTDLPFVCAFFTNFKLYFLQLVVFWAF